MPLAYLWFFSLIIKKNSEKSVADPDLRIRGEGGGGEGWSSIPWDKRGARPQNQIFFLLSGASVRSKNKGGPSLESATDNHIPTDRDTSNKEPKEPIIKFSSLCSRRDRLAEELGNLEENGEVTLLRFLEPSPPKLSHAQKQYRQQRRIKSKLKI